MWTEPNLSLAVISIIIVLIVALVAIRTLLYIKSKALQEKLNNIKPYSEASTFKPTQPSAKTHVGIFSDLTASFNDTIISSSDAQAFANYYRTIASESSQLIKTYRLFLATPPETISDFLAEYQSIDTFVRQHNEHVINQILFKHKIFFDHCLKYPLDPQQRRSIVSEEDNCLVVSSAGSGKTSSIIGKVKYLTEIKGIAPERILLISYTNKAAAELTERMGAKGLRGYTFHKLALEIIGKTTKIKPTICDNTDSIFVAIYHELLEQSAFKQSIVEYFVDYQITESELEQKINERREELSEQKNAQLTALFPDMDGKTIRVRSAQEQKICFALSSFGVNFRYEEPYEHQLANEMRSQYRPDFSIYYDQNGTTKRIYLEHFGIDEHGLVPAWFAKDKNISIDEANKIYNDGITWKKAAHEKFGTTLLTTSSADFHYFDIKDQLRKQLQAIGVPIKEKSDEELFDQILPKGCKKEKAFIRLIITFVTLIKSSCKSIHDILCAARNANDERSFFIIKNLFLPVYEKYIKALQEINQIDFTDAILQATEICRTTHPVEYDYIIVDEFQDISLDRYNFLKELRKGNPPAKLYCVGDDWQSIYRFSGSDMALFNQFSSYFGPTEINKIETTYRFGEPLVSLSSNFIQKNRAQIQKNIHPFNPQARTDLEFLSYDKANYCTLITQIISTIPTDKSIFLLGRYSFDDYYLSYAFRPVKEGGRFYYIIDGRKIEFLTAHKSKGLEADYVILLQCNKDIYGFPSMISDDPVLNYVLTQSDNYPFGEERRLFYVAITRAKIKTFVLYNKSTPSLFVDEIIHPEKITENSYTKHPNANKKWTRKEERILLNLYYDGKSVKYIAEKLGRSPTSIVMRLNKLNQ